MGRPRSIITSDYDPHARLPRRETRWVWEIDQPHARALIEVTEVFWNGEQWWVETRTLLPRAMPQLPGDEEKLDLNELVRFWEAVTPAAWPHRGMYETADPATRERVPT